MIFAFTKMRGLSLLALLVLAAPACERLRQPPRPNGVPEAAVRDRSVNLWMYRADDHRFYMYYETGAVARTGQMQPGTNIRTGEWRTYASDGERVTSVGVYLENWRDGIWRYFDDTERAHQDRIAQRVFGTQVDVALVCADRKARNHHAFDDTERVYLTVAYQPEPKRFFGFLGITDYGNENGPFERFFPDGSLEERGVFWSGYYHGPIVRYHRNGNKAFEGNYEKDEPVGLWRYYYPEGNLEREESYRAGRLHGTLRNYYPDGRLYQETVFENGREIGPKRVFLEPSPASDTL